MDIASEKQQAHELIDRLDETQIAAVVRFLEFMMMDPSPNPLRQRRSKKRNCRTKRAGQFIVQKPGFRSVAAKGFRWRKCLPISG